MTTRKIQQVIKGIPTSDGAGVKLTRSIGSSQRLRVDPFLMLDEFSSDASADYIGGFPPHPHRGFETVTYMLEGHMLHEDHMGNKGHLRDGDVQWMTAGSGIVHSEMPQQTEGRMRGFQLWVNLPAKDKMQPAAYSDIPATDIPRVQLANGGSVKIIAGSFDNSGQISDGPINGCNARLATDPLYLDIQLPANGLFQTPIDPEHNAFTYIYEGAASIEGQALALHHAGILGDGEQVEISAGAKGARLLLLAGKPLNEPIAQYGPFVMNTPEEIDQAIRDYQDGTLTNAS